MKLLTIGIPTFKNNNGVSASLENIGRQITAAHLEQEVDVVISDNSEDVETQVSLQPLLAKYPFAQYYRNNKNLGFDRNIDRILSLSQSSFCWLLSDNDPIQKGAISHISQILRETQDVAHVIICPETISKEKLHRYENIQEAIETCDFSILGGLISRNVFAMRTIPRDRNKYFGIDWIHLAIAMDVDGEHPVMLAKELLSTVPDDECKWAKHGKTLRTYINLLRIMDGLNTPPYSKEFKEKMVKQLLQGIPKQVLSGKLYGVDISTKTFTVLWSGLRRHLIYLVIASLLIFIPTPLLQYAKKLKNYSHH